VKFHLEDDELGAITKIISGEDASQHVEKFQAVFSRWIPQVEGHMQDILEVIFAQKCGKYNKMSFFLRKSHLVTVQWRKLNVGRKKKCHSRL
jgi:hypothetical protein